MGSFRGDARSFTATDRRKVVGVLGSEVFFRGVEKGESFVLENEVVVFRFNPFAVSEVGVGITRSDFVLFSLASASVSSPDARCVFAVRTARGGRAVYEVARASAELGIVGKRLWTSSSLP